MPKFKCPGYCGKWYWWGRCIHVLRYGIGYLTDEGSTEYLCQHPNVDIVNAASYVAACPTKGKKP